MPKSAIKTANNKKNNVNKQSFQIQSPQKLTKRMEVMLLNATFNNISVISWQEKKKKRYKCGQYNSMFNGNPTNVFIC